MKKSITKKITKKVLALLLCICTVLSFSMIANAATIPEPEVAPCYEVTCPGGAKHQMLGVYTGYVYSGSSLSSPGSLVMTGQAYQCKHCYLALVTEYNLFYSYNTYPGKYAFTQFSQQVSTPCFYGGIDGTFTGNMASDSFWAGFTFDSTSTW